MTTKKHAFYILAAMIVAIMFSAGPAKATSLYSTLGPSGQFDTTAGWVVEGSSYSNQVIAGQFSVNTTATLTNALLGIGNYEGGNNPISLYLESNAGGVPGAILTTLTQVGTIPPFGTNSLTNFTSGGYTLTSGTLYWLVAVETDPGTGQAWNWAYLDTPNTIAYNQAGSATGPWNTLFVPDVAFQINGTTVPDSGGTVVLLGVAIIVVGLLHRRIAAKRV